MLSKVKVGRDGQSKNINKMMARYSDIFQYTAPEIKPTFEQYCDYEARHNGGSISTKPRFIIDDIYEHELSTQAKSRDAAYIAPENTEEDVEPEASVGVAGSPSFIDQAKSRDAAYIAPENTEQDVGPEASVGVAGSPSFIDEGQDS